jgi:hypothetical protein
MRSDHTMQFFTPELYRRYNSPDDAIALAADAEWETAIVQYRQYLSELDEKMPSEVMELSKLGLHDGEILQREEQHHPLAVRYFEGGPSALRHWPFWYGLAILAVRLDEELVTLFYFLSDHVVVQPAAEDWPFSKEREHWLYDEVHWRPGNLGNYAHLILLSSGIVLAIPFSSVSISRFSLSSAESSKRSA